MATVLHSRPALAAIATVLLAGVAHGEMRGHLGDGNRLFSVQYETLPIVEADIAWWRGDARPGSGFALQTSRTVVETGRRYALEGIAKPQLATIDGHVEVAPPGQASWTIRFKEEPDGGAIDTAAGVAFRIPIDALAREGFAPVPKLKDDRTGWSLVFDPDQPPLTVEFSAPVARLDFTQGGDHGEIRAYVFTANDAPDAADLRMTLTIPGTLGPSPRERVAARSESWWTNELHWNRAPVDLAFLNDGDRPAGKRGFLSVDGEDLVFEDGTKARFWGTNITAFALFRFSNPETVRQQAKRLAMLGFNLVRIHHHDSRWVSPNVFGRRQDNTRALDIPALEQLDWWIKCLRDEGIYVWLDLHVGRRLTAADGVEAFDEIAEGKPPTAGMQGYLFVNDSLQARMREFAEAYLSRVNRHTGLAYKDDPAVVAVLVTNENDLTHHFGNFMMPARNVPWHTERYMTLARVFSATHGLDFNRVWRSWEFGPSKIFLADLEHRYFSETADYLRDLGVRVPIVGTNYWGGMSVAGLTALAEGDLIAAHSYGHANEVERNPRFSANIASWMAGGAVAGKPFAVSEWNAEPVPTFDRFQLPPYLAAIAGLQGWRAMLQYAYTQSPMMARGHIGGWESYTDPATMALMPAAALMFRNGHVSEARTTFELALPEEVFVGQAVNARTSRAIRTLTEMSKLRVRIPEIKALDWARPAAPASGATQVTDPDFDAIGEGATRVCSDTGELCRDWKQGVFTVDTEKSQVASGWLGGREIALGDVAMSLSTKNAIVAVQSLDDAPISRSGRIMISMSAQAVPAVPAKLPYVSEPVEGKLRIRAQAGLKAYRADRDGDLHAVPFESTADGYVLKLGPDTQANWLFLQ